VELREFNDEIYESFGEAAAAVFDETRQHSDLADRIYKSFEESRNSLASWLKLADVDYSIKRNKVLGI
jgi:TRAP-type mannitol/chloroaromatic compound transport system substrate-binding protein